MSLFAHEVHLSSTTAVVFSPLAVFVIVKVWRAQAGQRKKPEASHKDESERTLPQFSPVPKRPAGMATTLSVATSVWPQAPAPGVRRVALPVALVATPLLLLEPEPLVGAGAAFVGAAAPSAGAPAGPLAGVVSTGALAPFA